MLHFMFMFYFFIFEFNSLISIMVVDLLKKNLFFPFPLFFFLFLNCKIQYPFPLFFCFNTCKMQYQMLIYKPILKQ